MHIRRRPFLNRLLSHSSNVARAARVTRCRKFCSVIASLSGLLEEEKKSRIIHQNVLPIRQSGFIEMGKFLRSI